MVAFGEYANAHSIESYELLSPKERAKKHKVWTDRWAVLFVSLEDALKMQSEQPAEERRANELSLEDAASILM